MSPFSLALKVIDRKLDKLEREKFVQYRAYKREGSKQGKRQYVKIRNQIEVLESVRKDFIKLNKRG